MPIIQASSAHAILIYKNSANQGSNGAGAVSSKKGTKMPPCLAPFPPTSSRRCWYFA